jgi:predicted flap endonuclease-1-like 5' DNA nuclease
MTYLMFEMSAWLLAAFVAGLLLGAWVGYACRSNTEDATPADDSESEDGVGGLGETTDTVEAGREADLVDEPDEPDEVDQSSVDESKNNLEMSDALEMESDVDDARPINLISEPVSGGDDLKKLKGVGPKLEKLLNGLGIYNFQQIADWQQKDVDWVNAQLAFSGRIEREDWVSQAKTLADGGTTEFAEREKKENQD